MLKQMLWNCARATTIANFNRRMLELKEDDVKAHEWLLKKDLREWSKSHFRVNVKCDILLNNLCESFNSVIMPQETRQLLPFLRRSDSGLCAALSTKDVRYTNGNIQLVRGF